MADAIQADATTIQNLRELLQSSYELRLVSERNAEGAREALVKVAKHLCSAKADRERRAIETHDAEGLAQWIIDDVADRLEELEWYRSNNGNGQSATPPVKAPSGKDDPRVLDLQKQLEARQHEADNLKVANRGYEEQIKQLLADNTRLRSELDAFRSAPSTLTESELDVRSVFESPAVSVDLWPDWLKEMQAGRGFANRIRLVKAIGATWECRRSRIVDMLQKPGTDSGWLKTLPKTMTQDSHPLIAIFGQDDDGASDTQSKDRTRVAKKTGRPGSLLALTDDGREVYQLIFGAPPLRAYDQYHDRHKSDDQVMLVLETIDWLEWAGYTVDRFPVVANLPGGHVFDPDLVAQKDGREVAVEVETGNFRNQRDQKWTNAAEATHGQIYIVTPNREAMEDVSTELMSWQVGRPTVRVYLTNLSELDALRRQGKLDPAGDIWLRKR